MFSALELSVSTAFRYQQRFGFNLYRQYTGALRALVTSAICNALG